MNAFVEALLGRTAHDTVSPWPPLAFTVWPMSGSADMPVLWTGQEDWGKDYRPSTKKPCFFSFRSNHNDNDISKYFGYHIQSALTMLLSFATKYDDLCSPIYSSKDNAKYPWGWSGVVKQEVTNYITRLNDYGELVNICILIAWVMDRKNGWKKMACTRILQ